MSKLIYAYKRNVISVNDKIYHNVDANGCDGCDLVIDCYMIVGCSAAMRGDKRSVKWLNVDNYVKYVKEAEQRERVAVESAGTQSVYYLQS